MEYNIGQEIIMEYYWGFVKCKIVLIESDKDGDRFIYLESEYEEDNIQSDPRFPNPYFDVIEYNDFKGRARIV